MTTTYTPPFYIKIKFNYPPDEIVRGETPHQLIFDNNNRCVMELEETPVLPGGQAVEDAPSFWRWEGHWSTDVADWMPGPFTQTLVLLMNEEFATQTDSTP